MINVIIGYRPDGPIQQHNLDRVVQQWRGHGAAVEIVDDRNHKMFNRFAAYNKATANATVLIYTEPDILLPSRQIRKAITLAAARPGLVVPFREYRILKEVGSREVWRHKLEPADCKSTVTGNAPAVHILSKTTLESVRRFDDTFEGWRWGWQAMRRAFHLCAGPTRWVEGPAYQLHRPPLDETLGSDKDARRLDNYMQATTTDRIHELTTGGW